MTSFKAPPGLLPPPPCYPPPPPPPCYPPPPSPLECKSLKELFDIFDSKHIEFTIVSSTIHTRWIGNITRNNSKHKKTIYDCPIKCDLVKCKCVNRGDDEFEVTYAIDERPDDKVVYGDTVYSF